MMGPVFRWILRIHWHCVSHRRWEECNIRCTVTGACLSAGLGYNGVACRMDGGEYGEYVTNIVP